MDYLSMATYESPPRPVRARKLNTIMEDHEETNFGVRSESETDTSEGTIVGRPMGGDARYYVAVPPKKSRLATATLPPAEGGSPNSDCSFSPCSSAGTGVNRNSTRSSLVESDDGTVFSDTCPSLGESTTSDPTTFATNSSRSSVVSTKSNRNRYPTILIPRQDSWTMMENALKDNAVKMSPAPKIALSPAVLSALPKWVPAFNAPPSLGDGSSVTSESPSIPAVSAPVTPDMRVIQVVENENWGAPQEGRRQHRTPSPEEEAEDMHRDTAPESAIIERGEESDCWSSIVGKFPDIPGGTPEENSPIPPDIEGAMGFLGPSASEDGVWLPPDALLTLENLIRERSPATQSEGSMTGPLEMEEVTVPPSRPRSVDGATPSSDYSGYSFSQLSIPSPGGFFSSLKAGTRHTWGPGQPKVSHPPSSTTAENFYNTPWNQPERTVQTVLEVGDATFTDGPPTARQPVFGNIDPRSRAHSKSSSEEDPDMYGSSRPRAKTPTQANHHIPPTPIRYEYEEAYEDEITKTAEQNIDRTSTWLAAQTTYMSALRESNPVNDLSDPSAPTVHPSSHAHSQAPSQAQRKTVHFLFDPTASPLSFINGGNTPPKDPTLLAALTHHLSTRKRLDPFLHATPRLDAIHSFRLIQPTTHHASLLGKFTPPCTISHPRPKYSGPFSQNPRQTGIFDLTPAQSAFRSIEHQQTAQSQLHPNAWAVDGLRYLQGGRLLASSAACRRLSAKATLPLSDPQCIGKKRLRVLDLGGIAACDWAWQVAARWPNVKVYTVLTKTMAELQLPPHPQDPASSSPPTTQLPQLPGSPQVPKAHASPSNHRTISVPHLWALPFRDNHFDVVSARSLHALLKAEPVPGVKGIDEYDMTLKEVMRVLKPGGWFEFAVMDSAVVRPRSSSNPAPANLHAENASVNGKTETAQNQANAGTAAVTGTAGSRGEALSVEFGFQLKMRGYEREPTRTWLPRLRRLGFVGVKRAWMFLPMGNPLGDSPLGLCSRSRGGSKGSSSSNGRDGGRTWKDAPRPMSEVSVRKILDEYLDVEAVRGPVGGTAEAADVCGLVGGAMWEGWVVKMRRECGREESRVGDGLAEVIFEGREGGAGWRVLLGWARKPGRDRGSRISEMTEAASLRRAEGQMGTIRVLMAER